MHGRGARPPARSVGVRPGCPISELGAVQPCYWACGLACWRDCRSQGCPGTQGPSLLARLFGNRDRASGTLVRAGTAEAAANYYIIAILKQKRWWCEKGV